VIAFQPPARDAITLGVLAGGRGTRLGGCAKAWIVRDGMTQVERLLRRFERDVAHAIVSANEDAARFETLGVAVVADRVRDVGPIGGLDALARACTTPWLLTVPVDLVFVNDCLVPTFAGAGGQGASIEDADGPQPLIALWNVEALRATLDSRANGDLSVQSLQQALGMPRIRLDGVRFGNLNTFDDLAAVGARLP
jgi:molybdenum cofactor guanylyltransferase